MDEQKPSLTHSLRVCARVALEEQGCVVKNKPGLGIKPGSRLRVQHRGRAQQTVAVRVSKKRKIGISRNQRSGEWFEVPGLNEVVVVSPSLHDDRVADVYGFDPEVLIQTFNVLDTERNGPYSKTRKLNFPIFVALDPQPEDEIDNSTSNLIQKASWKKAIPLPDDLVGNAPAPARRSKLNREGFIERVRREFAEINGVDSSKVIVNFHIVG